MAKDVSNKPISTNNSSDTASSSISDHQKVPPLRICLNTTGNQKSSSTTTPTAPPTQQQDLKREKPRDSKASDNTVKSGGRVRIRLGTNKQSSGSKVSSNEQISRSDDSQKGAKDSNSEQKDSNSKEELNVNYSHLRRITRRSNRTVQAVSNEDEESISSMTSTDDYQVITTNNSSSGNNHNSDSNSAQETISNPQNNASTPPSTSTTTTVTNPATNSTTVPNPETPRRKRRKGEVSESLSCDHESLFGLQNYKLPHQNSFELFKNIRKQVDKKLKSLNSVHPKTPYGFRDYMLNKGAYLLEGNKLGNGATLFKNENGGMHTAPAGKYHALRFHKVNYMVPDRAKVPSVIPLNSPLYGLFIDQEKERYRMRMQHTKEREKLTLAAEQEIMRVYNQAALTAANQNEPFSACTMLKHQEIYNYLDSDGMLIQTREDAQQDQLSKPDGVRTRRRQHERISPTPGRKSSSNADLESNVATDNGSSKDDKSPTNENVTESSKKDSSPEREPTTSPVIKEKAEIESGCEKLGSPETKTRLDASKEIEEGQGEKEPKQDNKNKSDENTEEVQPHAVIDSTITETTSDTEKELDPKGTKDSKTEVDTGIESVSEAEADSTAVKIEPIDTSASEKMDAAANALSEAQIKEDDTDAMEVVEGKDDKNEEQATSKQEDGKANFDKDPKPVEEGAPVKEEVASTQETTLATESTTIESNTKKNDDESLSEEDQREYDKDMFLSQLQEVDDKWDKIRREMLIRHRNEAESLHAIQKLEWEWKTKEIGACDVRTTPIIDNTLVPKLNVYSQDY